MAAGGGEEIMGEGFETHRVILGANHSRGRDSSRCRLGCKQLGQQLPS